MKQSSSGMSSYLHLPLALLLLISSSLAMPLPSGDSNQGADGRPAAFSSSSDPADPASGQKHAGSTSHAAQIAGAVVALVIVVVLSGVGVWLLMRMRKRKAERNERMGGEREGWGWLGGGERVRELKVPEGAVMKMERRGDSSDSGERR